PFDSGPHHPTPDSFPTRRSSDLHFTVANQIDPRISDVANQISRFGEEQSGNSAAHSQLVALGSGPLVNRAVRVAQSAGNAFVGVDRKSTRLNSSHQIISYAVFCF